MVVWEGIGLQPLILTKAWVYGILISQDVFRNKFKMKRLLTLIAKN